ncbi:hypothetical protein N7492_002357 [Penicillium capsulatum]|uniref:Uncharacterized protein n=1 Tax=Penicillium capsulatum TaxID=69766 RepID=A0A9W9IJX7_9EURO|nr:hypothetical protein N7492_002357 [Penicillium capsulatum]KAJ6123037.1 hypothetical protein N7512_005502 [Penicillium capsulatum]
MRSMRAPFGSLDTRVTMTDSLADGLLSPSFASVLAFDDSPGDNHGLGDMCSRLKNVHPARPHKPDNAHEKPRRAYPRLELDAIMDKHHALDGLAEPLNPQNTPASNSGHDSPDEADPRRQTDNLRTTSAPHLNLRWFENQPDGSLLFVAGRGDEAAGTQKRRFSADDEPRPTTLLKTIHQTPGDKSHRESEDAASSFRCVRFTPPPESSQQRSPRLVQHPLPSVERKQDYIASYRQQRQYEKWKGPNRALSQRLSPYRSPPKIPKSARSFNQEPNFHFSTASKLPFNQDESSCAESAQETSDDVPLGLRDLAPREAGDAHDSTQRRPAYDLVAVTFCVYRFRDHGPEGVSHIRVDSAVVPASHLLQETGQEKNAVIRTSVDDLLLHTCVIMPAFILRVPLAILSAADRIAASRVAIVTINALRMLCAVFVRFVTTIVARMLGQDVSDHAERSPSKRHGRQRH